MDRNRIKGVVNMDWSAKQEPKYSEDLSKSSDLSKIRGIQNISLSNDNNPNDKRNLDPTIANKQENS